MFRKLDNFIFHSFIKRRDYISFEKKEGEAFSSIHSVFTNRSAEYRSSKHSGLALKASATVETTMVMPLVLLVIFFLISVGFYEHDKAVFTEQSFLTARSISMYGEERIMDNKLMAMCLAAKGIDINSEENLIKTSNVSEGTVRMIMFGKALKLMSEEHYVKCYAPDLIRTIRVGENIKDSIIERK